MKRKFELLSCLAVVFIIAGCAKELEGSIQNRGKMIERSYMVSMAQDTRTSYSEGTIYWEPGDKIKYYSCDGQQPEIHTIDARAKDSEIKATVGENDEYLIAFYGDGECSDNTLTGMTISGAVKGEQDGTFAKSHFSAARISDISATEISFHNVTSLVKFSIDRTDVETMNFMTNDGSKICGSVKITFDENNIPSAVFAGDGGRSFITVNTGCKAGTFYFATLPAEFKNGFTCTFYDKDEKLLGIAKTAKNFKIERNQIINLGNLDAGQRIDSDFEDLSRNESANCYLVTKVGNFVIDARYKGNSKTESVGEIAGVKVLWETNNTNYSPGSKGIIKDVEYVDGHIRFTSVADGNASIAALDKDGGILWSWHIWVCLDYDAFNSGQEYLFKYKDKEVEDKDKYVIGRFMDRNLGALSNIPGNSGVYGLLYEWGRKDPFLGHNTTSTIVWINEESTAETGTVEYAVKNPTSFLYGTVQTGRDWLFNGHDDTLWGDEKTIYDPCPPGWKVPDSDVWTKAFGFEGSKSGTFDGTNKGMQFGRQLGPDESIWYPAAGYRDPTQKGIQQNFGRYGFWWSCDSGTDNRSYLFKIYFTNDFFPKADGSRSGGYSVRCVSTYVKDPVPVKSVTVSPKTLELNIYHSQKLEYSIMPEDADNRKVIWSSSDENVATVEDDGTVTACGEGSCRIYVKSQESETICDFCEITVKAAEMLDLSAGGTANCYIVSTSGSYKFKADVKGGSNEPVSNGAGAKVLWESYGNDIPLDPGSIISDAHYASGYISFNVSQPMKNGNAVVALVDGSDNILWSWHIWAFKGFDPEKSAQKYYNGAEMMNCNLGAVSTEKGNVQSLGVMYQWGRKDPFLASGTLTGKTQAVSTLAWPQPVSPASIDYSIKNPTTFIIGESASSYDWATTRDNTRWGSSKTKYDPCPPGWRVPDGGASGVWCVGNAKYPNLTIMNQGIWDDPASGCEFGGVLGSDNSIWYPASEYRHYTDGNIYGQTMYGLFWSVTSNAPRACNLYFCEDMILLSSNTYKAQAMPVRCMKDGTYTGVPVTGVSINASGSGYLSKVGDYIELEAVLTPENASYKYVAWDCFDSFGNIPDASILTVAIDGSKVKITRKSEHNLEESFIVQAMSPDGDKYAYYTIYLNTPED